MASLAARLSGAGQSERLHLQHGPIDLLLDCRGEPNAVEHAYAAAASRFETVLTELVEELTALRCQTSKRTAFRGQVARRMQRATLDCASRVFVTPMAAVAGAVADEVLSVAWRPGLRCASVNNGGDIAVKLAPGERTSLRVCGLDNTALADFNVAYEDGVGGIATSGRGGRSLSLGIADSVTVLARNAAQADVAATLIANAVDLPDCERIEREPASHLDPDSDLGERLVVTRCGVLRADEVSKALDRGAERAESWVANGYIETAALFLRGQHRIVGQRSQLTLSKQGHSRKNHV